MTKEDEVKEQLLASNTDFRRMAAAHRDCEVKLYELQHRQHLTDQDRLDEVELKKKKLHLKDRMNSMIQLRAELSTQPS